jgi:hypothetical protein
LIKIIVLENRHISWKSGSAGNFSKRHVKLLELYFNRIFGNGNILPRHVQLLDHIKLKDFSGLIHLTSKSLNRMRFMNQFELNMLKL